MGAEFNTQQYVYFIRNRKCNLENWREWKKEKDGAG